MMNGTNSSARIGVAVALLLFAVAATPCAAGDSPVTLVDRPEEQRLLLTVAAFETDGVASRAVVVPADGLSHGAVLHRFAAELIDADGRVVDGAWRVSLRTVRVRGDAAHLVRLGSALRDLVLPRPFGVRVEAGDSVVVVLQLDAASGADAVELRVSMMYEAGSAAGSRLPVQPLAAEPIAAPGHGGRSWELRPGTSGRIVVVAGTMLDHAREIVLEDVATGTVLWRLHSARQDSFDFGRQGSVVRPSAAVEAGRLYRLTIVIDEGAPAPDAPLHALLMAVARAH